MGARPNLDYLCAEVAIARVYVGVAAGWGDAPGLGQMALAWVAWAEDVVVAVTVLSSASMVETSELFA